MASYSLLITHSPVDVSQTMTAQGFARQLLNQGHTIKNVFFYGEGTYHASAYSQIPSDEYQWSQQWQHIQIDAQCALLVCITAAIKRGLFSEAEADETGMKNATIMSPFEQAGLGEFFTQLHDCEHLVQF